MMRNRIIVIDDSPTICKIIEICLGGAGYEVKCFSDGIRALAWMRSGQQIPDLFLVDVCLPKMDGYSVIRHLRGYPVFHKTPFIIVTRQDGFLDRLKGRLVGAVASVMKPFKTEELVSLVQTYLGDAMPG